MSDDIHWVSFIGHFSALNDPRHALKVVCSLKKILLSVLCGTEQAQRFRREILLELDVARLSAPLSPLIKAGVPN